MRSHWVWAARSCVRRSEPTTFWPCGRWVEEEVQIVVFVIWIGVVVAFFRLAIHGLGLLDRLAVTRWSSYSYFWIILLFFRSRLLCFYSLIISIIIQFKDISHFLHRTATKTRALFASLKHGFFPLKPMFSSVWWKRSLRSVVLTLKITSIILQIKEQSQ